MVQSQILLPGTGLTMNRPTAVALGTALTSVGLAIAVLPQRTKLQAGALDQVGAAHKARPERREAKAMTALRGFAEGFDIDLDALLEQPGQPVRVERAMSGSR